MDSIEIEGLRLRALIGFSAHELDEPQDVVIDLSVGLRERLAGETDEPAHAWNYRTLSKAVIQLVERSRYSLLEKLAEAIACMAVMEYGAPLVEVRVRKPGALRHSLAAGLRIRRCPASYARNIVYLSLGSNIAPERNLPAAAELLRRYTTLLKLSPVYRSPPQGYASQPDFLNMAARVHTLRAPARFKTEVLDRIERELKRVRDPGNINAPRTIDLDIALWNDEELEFGAKPWRIPDPAILRYAHVALPLADLAPDYRRPLADESLREIASRHERLERVELDFGPRPM